MNRLDVPTHINLAQWFFHRTFQKNKTSFITKENSVTYQELENKVRRAASSFSQHNGRPGQRVIISLNDSLELIILFLAALATGMCPIVLNPRLKPLTLTYILKDSDPSLLFFEEDTFTSASEISLTLNSKTSSLFYRQETAGNTNTIHNFLLAGDSTWDNYHYSNPSKQAFIQYTSGTTGNPKGVIHSSLSVLACCQLFATTHLELTEKDILYSTSKMFFGFGMGNSIFFPLFFSASAIIDPNWPTLENILDNIKNFSPTVLFAPPVIYQRIFENGTEQSTISSIRLLFSAGSPFPEKLQHAWNKKYHNFVYEGLGATETCHVFMTNDKCNFKPGSTGKMINGYKHKLITSNGHEASPGEQGVLYVAGPTIALGYWNKEKDTQDKFLEEWYRTGDIFSCDQSGFFYYHGREDDLFKINGRWVIPSNIESFVKNNFIQVEEAFLVPVANNYQTEPTLFLTGKFDDKKNIAESILILLASNVGGYQTPTSCVFIDDLPRNDNGKILRSMLSNHDKINFYRIPDKRREL